MRDVQKNTDVIVVTSPFSGAAIGEVGVTPVADLPIIQSRLELATKSMAALTKHERARILKGAAKRVEESLEDYARMIASEAGKPISQARNEVRRCVNTLTLSAHGALELHGETIPFDSYPSGRERTGFFTREPMGAVLAVTPFNDPLNLVAHKLGPAIAVGNPIVLKPSERTPFSAERLVGDMLAAGLPEYGIQLIHGGPELVQAALKLPFRMVSFTGGFTAAEAIVAAGGVKKYAMDLGGNAAVIVMPDCDLEMAVSGCVDGAFGSAGQNCIGVQRILVHRDIRDVFEIAFVEKTNALVVGDPLNDKTEIGPMIGVSEAARAEQWAEEAVNDGAILLTGGRREGGLFWPTALRDVNHESKVWCQEAFAPVVSIVEFSDYDDAILMANESDVSLHAGIYTGNLEVALDASRRLEAAGVMINETSDYRFDGMPFGGFKKGSMGREGVKFSIEEMSQPKTVCFSR